MMQPGPKNLITDVEGIVVGNAEDQKIKTGVTVLIDIIHVIDVHVLIPTTDRSCWISVSTTKIR